MDQAVALVLVALVGGASSIIVALVGGIIARRGPATVVSQQASAIGALSSELALVKSQLAELKDEHERRLDDLEACRDEAQALQARVLQAEGDLVELYRQQGQRPPSQRPRRTRRAAGG